jgi:hypothetical protein
MSTNGRVSRQVLIARAQALHREIAENAIDIAHWNELHKNEPPIDPDPDGLLTKIAAGLDDLLTREARR